MIKPKFPYLTGDPHVTRMAGHQEKPHSHIPFSLSSDVCFAVSVQTEIPAYNPHNSLIMKTSSKLLPSLNSLMTFSDTRIWMLPFSTSRLKLVRLTHGTDSDTWSATARSCVCITATCPEK